MMNQRMFATLNGSSSGRVLDVRPAVDFERLHRAGAVNIPLDELTGRIHELPPRETPITIYDANETRARWAMSRLRMRNRAVGHVLFGEDWLRAGPTARGASRDKLWQPHALLAEAVRHCRRLPSNVEGCRALEIACGSGRDAVFLAMSGFDVEAWDVLPDAVALCDALAERYDVIVRTRCWDVEANPEIEEECYDLVSCFNFLHRPIMSRIADAVRPGGLVVYETFVHPQRDLFGRPRREAQLLQPAELPMWFEGWTILASREGLTGPRRFAASLIARRPA